MNILPWYGSVIAAVVIGSGLVWWMRSRLRQAEQDQLDLAGRKAYDRGEVAADASSRDAEDAAQGAKKNAEDGW